MQLADFLNNQIELKILMLWHWNSVNEAGMLVPRCFP